MKVLQINSNYNKNTQFCGNQCLPTANWIALRDALSQSERFRLNENTILKTGYLPTFNKPHFEYSDYKALSPKEKLIIHILNKKGSNLECYFTHRKDLSIEKDAERILEFASKTKEYFDNKYKKGYKLVGIGNSPAPIVETMQLLGADAITLPFSRQLIEQCDSREFPYEHWVPEDSYYGHTEKCSAKDWEEYFKFYGLDKDFSKNTGKALIFTDYISEGWTQIYFESILKGLGFDKNYEFIETDSLLPRNIELHPDYNLSHCLDSSDFKVFAKMESPKYYYRDVDIIKHPEYIPSLPGTIKSKLFRCALYDLISKQ